MCAMRYSTKMMPVTAMTAFLKTEEPNRPVFGCRFGPGFAPADCPACCVVTVATRTRYDSAQVTPT
ncbi:hypothetical protein [Klenkia marina]|uniref:hypothetical protein n=1 Tax=Klenkia marina TaxID=1960309 RepID=UPI003C740AD8